MQQPSTCMGWCMYVYLRWINTAVNINIIDAYSGLLSELCVMYIINLVELVIIVRCLDTQRLAGYKVV